jgi:hypothetical protein
VLERVQPKVHEFARIGNAADAEDTAHRYTAIVEG